MITVTFRGIAPNFNAVTLTGHAGYGEYGEDIVCSAVTSALQLTSNGITEVLKVSAEVQVQENLISIALPPHPPEGALRFLEALHLHLTVLAEGYEGTIKVISEV